MAKDFEDRKVIQRAITQLEQDLKELEIRYEQYFAGIEKREPLKERENLTRRIRQMGNRHIIQTELRFRQQSIAARFHSYAGNWDRILRLMDEGKYHRQLGVKPAKSSPPVKSSAPGATSSAKPKNEIDHLYRELAEAHRSSGSNAPGREQFEAAINKQRSKIREKFGERDVEFRVTVENGKPRIKVRPKN